MAEDVRRIRSFVAGLVLRERMLLLARVAGRVVLLPALGVVLLALATILGVERATGALMLVVALGVGAWLAAALPLLREWRATGDALRQARKVEDLQPGLRGRLVTSVEALQRGSDAESRPGDALLGLVVARACAGIGQVKPAQVHRPGPALVTWGAAGAAGLAALVVLAVVGPSRVATFWMRHGDALADVSATLAGEAPDLAHVGDLVVTYRYPDYTGLKPKVVPNGTGDVEAPPGTLVEIAARSAHPVEAAGLVAYDENLEAGVADEGRAVTGSFAIRKEAGIWRFVVYRQGAPEQSRDFAITPQEDLPPDVSVSAGDRDVVEVAVDASFPVEWQARDDYGVRKVAVALDGKETERILQRPDGRKAELQGVDVMSPRSLGLNPGDRVQLSVVAWDNDTVSGSKRGESRSIELVVLGANGAMRQLEAKREELVEVMVPVLARFLTEPWPPGETGGALVAWGEEVGRRYQPLMDVVEASWKNRAGARTEAAMLERVLDTGRSLVRYTQVAFEPGSPVPPPDDSFRMTAKMRDEATVALEDALLALGRLQHNAALARISEQADQLAQAGERMEEALNKENPDAQELLAQLDQLERMLEKVLEEAGKLRDSGLKEFVMSRESEVRKVMDEVRKALAEGRTEDARELMRRLSQLLQEMNSAIDQQLESSMQQANDAKNEAEDLQKELEQLEKEQRQLQQEVQALREEDENADQVAKLWEELERRATEHRDAAAEFGGDLKEAGRAFFEQERAASGADAAEALLQAVQARDTRGARQDVDDGQVAWTIETRALEMEKARRGGQLPGPGHRELGELQKQLRDIERLLDQMDEQAGQSSPQTRAKSQELDDRQKDLENRTRQAAERAQQFEQDFPVQPRGLQEAMQEAQQRMQQASDDLGEGRPMNAEGSQGMAAQRLHEAGEALRRAREQAQQQMQQMQQQQGGGEGQEGEEQQSSGEEDGDRFDHDQLEIPGREEFRTPEEYRQALLEGMEGEVPEEYRAMKRRYFEDLVSQ